MKKNINNSRLQKHPMGARPLRGRKASVDPLVFIIGALTIIGGILYIANQSWGMLVVAIALLIESIKQVTK